MVLNQRLELRQSQTLVMTPQLQQAIKLLQMSNQELSEFVAKEIEENPLMELGESDDVSLSSAEGESVSEPVTEPGDSQDSSSRDTASEDDRNLADRDNAHQDGTPSRDEADFDRMQNVAERPSLRSHLISQIHIDFIEPGDRLVAVTLIELLDERGYLPHDLDLVRTQLGMNRDQFEDIIHRLQKCDPIGIFSRSLKECFEIQLVEMDRLDPAMKMLLDNLDLVARYDQVQLMKRCGVDKEDLTSMMADLRRCNPHPAMAFVSDVDIPLIPDVMLRPTQQGGWHIELNHDTLPKVLLNETYYTTVHRASRTKEEKDYVSEHWQRANWLMKALHQRATTILKVAAEIVRQQDAFFVHGVQHLKPLVLRDIALAVEMHESTVSRVTQNKYIATPRGLFELKYFFTTALSKSDGTDAISSESVRTRIRNLIESEGQNHILSDEAITEILKGEGIDIARRTVAKYREAMNYQSSAQRRREKKAY